MLFLGEFWVVFTGKGRIVVPKKIREVLQKQKTFILTKGFDSCLSGYKNEDWERGTKELMNTSVLETKKIEMRRHLFSSAVTVEIDDQGRIIIPQNLLNYADLTGKEAIFIGVGTYFEVWSPNRWSLYSKDVEENIKKLARE